MVDERPVRPRHVSSASHIPVAQWSGGQKADHGEEQQEQSSEAADRPGRKALTLAVPSAATTFLVFTTAS